MIEQEIAETEQKIEEAKEELATLKGLKSFGGAWQDQPYLPEDRTVYFGGHVDPVKKAKTRTKNKAARKARRNARK